MSKHASPDIPHMQTPEERRRAQERFAALRREKLTTPQRDNKFSSRTRWRGGRVKKDEHGFDKL
jgi:hypothetical protein